MAVKINTTINGKQYYRIRRKIDGKQKTFYGSSKADAEKKYKEYLEEAARRKYERQKEYNNATFGQRAKEYVENTLRVSSRFSKATKYQYELAYNKFVKNNQLSEIILAEVRASDVQTFYNDLDVSRQALSRVSKFMTNFCRWAVLNNYCDDFMSAVSLPVKPDNSRHDGIQIWEDREIREIIRSMNRVEAPSDRHRLFFMVHVMLYTGARISEALALRYSDFEDGVVNIQRQVYLNELKEPKYGSARQVPMHHKLSQALKAHERWHKEDMKKNHYDCNGYVFTTSTGKLYDPSSVRTALRRFYRSRGIPEKNPHTYRSTFCTQLCRCGVPLEVASSLLGHKSLEVTAAHYRLVRNDTKREAIDRLQYF